MYVCMYVWTTLNCPISSFHPYGRNFYLNPLLILKPLEVVVLIHTLLKSLALETRLTITLKMHIALLPYKNWRGWFRDMTFVNFPEQLFFECNCLCHILAFLPKFKISFSTFSCSSLIDLSSLSLLLSTKSSSNRLLGWWSAWSIVAAQCTALFCVCPLPLNCFCSHLSGSKIFNKFYFLLNIN